MRAEAKRRNSACAIAVMNHAKQLLGHEGAGARVKKKGGGTEVVQNRGKRKTIGKLIYGAFPSLPGQPPAQAKRTPAKLGRLGASTRRR